MHAEVLWQEVHRFKQRFQLVLRAISTDRPAWIMKSSLSSDSARRPDFSETCGHFGAPAERAAKQAEGWAAGSGGSSGTGQVVM